MAVLDPHGLSWLEQNLNPLRDSTFNDRIASSLIKVKNTIKRLLLFKMRGLRDL